MCSRGAVVTSRLEDAEKVARMEIGVGKILDKMAPSANWIRVESPVSPEFNVVDAYEPSGAPEKFRRWDGLSTMVFSFWKNGRTGA